MVTKQLPLILLLSLLAGTVFAEEQPANLYGVYEITAVELSGKGGLTSKEAAQKRLGISITIQEHRFTFPGWHGSASDIDKPRYGLRNLPVNQTEGEVPPRHERWGNFYGHGTDRTLIRLLDVYEPGATFPLFTFERVENELWFFGDGWLYHLNKH